MRLAQEQMRRRQGSLGSLQILSACLLSAGTSHPPGAAVRTTLSRSLPRTRRRDVLTRRAAVPSRRAQGAELSAAHRHPAAGLAVCDARLGCDRSRADGQRQDSDVRCHAAHAPSSPAASSSGVSYYSQTGWFKPFLCFASHTAQVVKAPMTWHVGSGSGCWLV